MKRNTLILLGVAGAALYLLSRRASASTAGARPGMAHDPNMPRLIPWSPGSVISNTGGASQGQILPDARAAQADTEKYGYGSGS